MPYLAKVEYSDLEIFGLLLGCASETAEGLVA